MRECANLTVDGENALMSVDERRGGGLQTAGCSCQITPSSLCFRLINPVMHYASCTGSENDF